MSRFHCIPEYAGPRWTVQLTVLCAAGLISSQALAQPAPQPLPDQPVAQVSASEPASLAAEPGLAIPLGNLGDGVGLGAGASLVYHRPVGERLAATGRVGVLYHDTEADVSLWVVPIVGGVRYYTSPGHRGAYLAGELGIFWARASGEVLGQSATVSDSELGATLAAGLRLSGVDLRAGLQIYDIGEIDDSLSLVGMASFHFASL